MRGTIVQSSLTSSQAAQVANSLNARAKALAVSWTEYGGKHVASSRFKWSDIIKSTKRGPAKYKHDTNIELLERRVHADGIPVNNGKPWKVMEFEEEIGASGGKVSRWIRVEESGGVIHGHPITREEFERLTKNI